MLGMASSQPLIHNEQIGFQFLRQSDSLRLSSVQICQQVGTSRIRQVDSPQPVRLPQFASAHAPYAACHDLGNHRTGRQHLSIQCPEQI